LRERPFEKGEWRCSDGLIVAFDDDHAVANAGLVLPATLAQRLGSLLGG